MNNQPDISPKDQKWKLNWRLLLLHFIGTWFIACSFATFSYLHNLDLLNALRNRQTSIDDVFRNHGFSQDEITWFVIWPILSMIAGIFISFLISLFVSIRNRWYWLSSVVLLIVCYYINRYELIDWSILGAPVKWIGMHVQNSLIWTIGKGSAGLLIGLLFFFSKPARRFIDKTYRKEADQYMELT